MKNWRNLRLADRRELHENCFTSYEHLTLESIWGVTVTKITCFKLHSSCTCSCKMQLFLIFYCKLNIKVKLLSICQLFVWHLSRFAGCGKYNSRYYCTKSVTFSSSKSGVFSPCLRHLRINVTSVCKFPCGGQQKVKIFSRLPSSICLMPCECSISKKHVSKWCQGADVIIPEKL